MNRAEYSQARIDELGSRLKPVESLLSGEPLCIYATGSYGRLEAGEDSDIDVFFLYEGHPAVKQLSNLTLIRLSACLIEATEAMDFPPFSGDGRYLDIHYLDHMEEVLGSPEDDSLNAFTARMLLLLESRPVYGDDRVLELCGLTPRQRFEALLGVGASEADDCIKGLLATYDAFLDHVQRPKVELLEDFRDGKTRRARLAEAGAFGEKSLSY